MNMEQTDKQSGTPAVVLKRLVRRLREARRWAKDCAKRNDKLAPRLRNGLYNRGFAAGLRCMADEVKKAMPPNDQAHSRRPAND